MENVLNNLCGKESYAMTLYNDEYRLKILLELTVKKLFDEVEKTVKRMMPANLILEVELRYNQHLQLKAFTHEYLKGYTHNGLREVSLN